MKSVKTENDMIQEFERIFLESKQIPLPENSNNGTDYLDPLVKRDLGLEFGEIVGTMDRGRKILIKGTRFGNVIIFQRYSDSNLPLVFNMPNKVKKAFTIVDGALNPSDFYQVFHTHPLAIS